MKLPRPIIVPRPAPPNMDQDNSHVWLMLLATFLPPSVNALMKDSTILHEEESV